MKPEKQSIRKTVMLNADVQDRLEQIIHNNKSWGIRTNTIIQAAIYAFADLPETKQKEYCKNIHYKDGRFF